jgi:hypothetical protein
MVSAERCLVSSLGSGRPVSGAFQTGLRVVVVVGGTVVVVVVVVVVALDTVVVVVESAKAAGPPATHSITVVAATARLTRLIQAR